jgi:HSP20 family protein
MLGELQPWFSGWLSVDRFRRDIDELFDRFFGEGGYRSPSGSMPTWPAVESFFKDGNWVMRFDLPGVEPKDIDVSVAGDTLTIRASRERRSDDGNKNFQMREVSYGRFERSLTLPKGVESGQIKASYQHGVLELTMPAAPELEGRKIPIEIGTEEKKRLAHQVG